MSTTALEADADALLKIIVTSEREVQARCALLIGEDLTTLSALSVPVPASNTSAIVADPLGPTYRAELHQIGCEIHKIGGVDALDEAIISLAVRDPSNADWRASVLECAWNEIGRDTA